MSRSASLGVLLDHAQDKIALLAADGSFTYVNDAAEQLLGYAPDDLVGTNTFDYIHPDDVDAVRERFSETIDSEGYTAGSVEYRFRAADGAWVWLESRMSNVTDDTLDGYVVSSRDITDRVTAERESKELSTRLRELSETSSDVLWMFDADFSELLFVNPAYESVFGSRLRLLRLIRPRFSMRSIRMTHRLSKMPLGVSRRAGRSRWSTASTRGKTTTSGCGCRLSRSSRMARSSASPASPAISPIVAAGSDSSR
jgi:PAS domain S-box-containing protein